MSYTLGPRQTIDRARHPVLGEGCAVYDNGPAAFIPDDGEPVPMATIGLGGCSSEPRRSWLVAYTTANERVELETTGRQGGERHRRRWSPLFGAGWLVDEAWPVWRPGMSADEEARYSAATGWTRFEPDDGAAPVRWQWHQMRVGRLHGREPARPKLGKSPSAAHVEWDRWSVVGQFEFRNEPPAEPQTTIGGAT